MPAYNERTGRFLKKELGDKYYDILGDYLHSRRWNIPQNIPTDTYRKLLILRHGVLFSENAKTHAFSLDLDDQNRYRRLLRLLKDKKHGLDKSGLRVLDKYLSTGNLTIPKKGFRGVNRIRLTVLRNLMPVDGLSKFSTALEKRYKKQVDALQRLQVVERPVKRHVRRIPSRVEFEPRIVFGKSSVTPAQPFATQAKIEGLPVIEADIPKKDIPMPWYKVLAKVPVDMKDYDSIPGNQKAKLFAAIKSHIEKERLFAFKEAKDKEGHVKYDPSAYLALAAGDMSGMTESFSREVFSLYRGERSSPMMKKNPSIMLPAILKAAEVNTRKEHSPDRYMSRYKTAVKTIPEGMKRLWELVKRAKTKTAAEWFKQMPPGRMASGKTTKEWVEGFVGRIVERHYAKYGISLALKGITFSDPYFQKRFKRDPKSRELVEGVYKKAFLRQLFDYLWVMKPSKSKRTSMDFYGGMMLAQRTASEKLHASLPKIKQIMVQADKKTAEQIQMVRRTPKPKGKAIA
jgi:hypothetical protein